MVTEYQMVAALVCMDIDMMADTAKRNPDMALGLLKKLKERKDRVVGDIEHRESRYSSTCNIFNLTR